MASVVYNNVLPWRGCEKLYMNSRTSDVKFIFRSGEIVKVPAHKSILSIISPVFDAMFYGPNKQDGDIDIVDATPEAFKEFLQFFYRSQVKLTAENVAEVLDLGRRYLLDDWQMVANAGKDLCSSAFTLDNMCMGYELAILFEMDELKKFCEKQIGENAAAVFHSSSFLSCEPNLLRHILQMDTFTCAESTVFDGCFAWAKAECVRKQCDGNDVQNLRAQLGELFFEIRFGDFAQKDFNHRYRMYDGLFSLEEFRDITMMIASKDFQPEKFNRAPRTHAKDESIEMNENYIVCNRNRGSTARDGGTSSRTIKFVSTSKLRLKKVSCHLFSQEKPIIEASVRIHEGCKDKSRGTLVSFVQTSLTTNANTNVELPAPILVEPGVIYEIDVELKSYAVPYWYEKTERLENGTVIDFFDDDDRKHSFVSGLHFIECKN